MKTVLAKLKVLAKEEGVTLPAAPSAAQQKTAKALMALHGRHFSRPPAAHEAG